MRSSMVESSLRSMSALWHLYSCTYRTGGQIRVAVATLLRQHHTIDVAAIEFWSNPQTHGNYHALLMPKQNQNQNHSRHAEVQHVTQAALHAFMSSRFVPVRSKSTGSSCKLCVEQLNRYQNIYLTADQPYPVDSTNQAVLQMTHLHR